MPRPLRVGELNPFYGHKHTPEWIEAHRARFNKWTDHDLLQLRVWYEARKNKPLRLAELAVILGRTKAMVSRKAREMGLTDHRRKTGRKPTAKFASDAERRLAIGEASRARIAANGHPRGMKGKTHTPEVRAQISKSQLALVEQGRHGGQRKRTDAERARMSATMSQRVRSWSSPYSRSRYGRRADLDGQFFRSMWEANYARFLNFLKARGEIAGWEYEAETFWFEQIRRGVRSYTPDFRVTTPIGAVYYVEVKGWMDPKSKTKIKRMAKYHPNVELRVVDAKAYREIARKLGPAIAGWETDNRGRA